MKNIALAAKSPLSNCRALEMVPKTDKVCELLKERAKSSTLHENGRHRAP